jgi:hypothetical protein
MTEETKDFPSITPIDIDKVTSITGVVIGVIPHLDSGKAAAARLILGATGNLDLSKVNVPKSVQDILNEGQVVYLVVGRWPPATPPVEEPQTGEWH